MMKPLVCGMALSLLLQLIQSKIDLFIISDQLCLGIDTITLIGIGNGSKIGKHPRYA